MILSAPLIIEREILMTDNESKPTDFCCSLKRRIWITKGSRFLAYRRLQKQHSLSIGAISLITIYVIALSLSLYCPAFSFDQRVKDIISFISIVSSVFILVLSLLESSKNYQLRSERLHNCAKELSAIYIQCDKIISECKDHIYEKHLEELIREYDTALRQCQENHDAIDHDLFMAHNSKEFEMNVLYKYYIIYFKSKLFPYGLNLLLILLPPFAFVILLLN